MIDYLEAVPLVREMVDDIERFVTRWLPSYAADSRSYLTIAIGCTGGQHRSVYCVEALARRLGAMHPALVRHRALAWMAGRDVPVTTLQGAHADTIVLP